MDLLYPTDAAIEKLQHGSSYVFTIKGIRLPYSMYKDLLKYVKTITCEKDRNRAPCQKLYKNQVTTHNTDLFGSKSCTILIN